jgi:hypothetical protein
MTTINLPENKYTPVLLIYSNDEDITTFDDDAIASVSLEFRYRKEGHTELQQFHPYDYRDLGKSHPFYHGLTYLHNVSTYKKEESADDFELGATCGFYYLGVGSIEEDQLSSMLETLEGIRSGMDAIAKEEGATTKLSEFMRRIAKIVKADEIEICDSRYSIEEGMAEIDEFVRNIRKELFYFCRNL